MDSHVVDSERGFVRLASHHSVAATLDRLEASLREHGVSVFSRIDFSADAAQVGLSIPPQQLLIFGNPRAGTALLAAAPSVGLDLPLKAAAWTDAAGQTWIAYNEPAYIVGRHGISPELAKNLAVVIPLLERAAAP